MALYNRVDNRILKQRLHTTPQERVTVSFYKYHFIENPADFRDELYKGLDSLEVMGRIYLAHEGINAQVSLPAKNQEAFKNYLFSITFLNNVRLNTAIDDDGKSFFKLKILVRKKIVADGLDDSSFDVTNSGVHVDAQQFNALVEDSNTVLIDMRNHYESEVGHFKNAICPDVDTFREELEVAEDIMNGQQDKNVVLSLIHI